MPRKLLFLPIILLFIFACDLPSVAPKPSVAPPVPASGTTLLQDDFSNPLSGWGVASTADGAMSYDGGVFRFVVNAPKFNFWSVPHKSFTDVRVEVDTAKLGGPDSNRAGIICRANGDKFYFFVISSDGYFAVGRAEGNQSVLLGQTQMAMSTNIHTGMAVNHLRADCFGNTLAFYINGFPTAQVQDSTLTSGDVGLIAGTFDTPGVDVIFDKFIVIQP